jgi:hypothetical protein
MAKDGAIFQPGKTKGEVNFPPFEDLDETSIREAEKYHIYSLGQIRECPRHIPYNSDKKSFLEKTGRESFEGQYLESFNQWLKLMKIPKCFSMNSS